ncbi:helix-turn-helix domain-containing protein, partial [Prevotella sp.]|uniref:helix-turn-helix domain-containing protein n=1 Tax=Prevotella sp. TaxID=59823 RepID=UPI003FEE1095
LLITHNKTLKYIRNININKGMDGLELKKILIGKGYMLKDIAAKLGMTQPNFSQIIKAQDIKTGTLESICDVLGVKMDFFYGETKYAPVTKQESTEDDQMATEDLSQKVQYLQGQLTAMKEAYRFLLDSLSTNGSSNTLRQAANE